MLLRECELYQNYGIEIKRSIVGNTMTLRVNTTYPTFDVIDRIDHVNEASCARENDCKDLVLQIKNVNLDNRSDKLEAIESLEFTLEENLPKIIQAIDGFRKLEEYEVIEEESCKILKNDKEEDIPEFLKRNSKPIRNILKEIELVEERDKNRLFSLLSILDR